MCRRQQNLLNSFLKRKLSEKRVVYINIYKKIFWNYSLFELDQVDKIDENTLFSIIYLGNLEIWLDKPTK